MFTVQKRGRVSLFIDSTHVMINDPLWPNLFHEIRLLNFLWFCALSNTMMLIQKIIPRLRTDIGMISKKPINPCL